MCSWSGLDAVVSNETTWASSWRVAAGWALSQVSALVKVALSSASTRWKSWGARACRQSKRSRSAADLGITASLGVVVAAPG